MNESKDYFNYTGCEFLKQKANSTIIEAGKMSKCIFFIIHGNVHVMDANGQYQYGILGEGSYFGDISAMLNEPNEFSYLYNPYIKQVDVLKIELVDWL